MNRFTRYCLLLLALLLALMTLAINAGPVRAQSKTYYWDSLDVDITVPFVVMVIGGLAAIGWAAQR